MYMWAIPLNLNINEITQVNNLKRSLPVKRVDKILIISQSSVWTQWHSREQRVKSWLNMIDILMPCIVWLPPSKAHRSNGVSSSVSGASSVSRVRVGSGCSLSLRSWSRCCEVPWMCCLCKSQNTLSWKGTHEDCRVQHLAQHRHPKNPTLSLRALWGCCCDHGPGEPAAVPKHPFPSSPACPSPGTAPAIPSGPVRDIEIGAAAPGEFWPQPAPGCTDQVSSAAPLWLPHQGRILPGSHPTYPEARDWLRNRALRVFVLDWKAICLKLKLSKLPL